MVGSYPLSSQPPTHVEVELGCDNFRFWAKKELLLKGVKKPSNFHYCNIYIQGVHLKCRFMICLLERKISADGGPR